MNFYEWFFQEKDRTPEGLFSFGHIFSVTLTLVLFGVLAWFLAKKLKDNAKKQNLVLLIAGIAIVLVQIVKVFYICWSSPDSPIMEVLIGNAPLYLCDMMIFIIPICALIKGRAKEICYDYIAIWGLLMGVMGTYAAGNIYGAHCVISFFAIVSLLNHAISAFASLFVWLCGLNKMEKKNIPFVIGVLVVYMTVALIVDYADHHNFMFFFHGDGTPFTFFEQNLSFNVIAIYQIEIYILQCGFMALFYVVYYWIISLIEKKKLQAEANS